MNFDRTLAVISLVVNALLIPLAGATFSYTISIERRITRLEVRDEVRGAVRKPVLIQQEENPS